MPVFTPLDGAQIRQQIDAEQVFEAYRSVQRERDRRFRGSMAWKTVNGRDYLYRKSGSTWSSLGPRSEQTEHAIASFQQGRSAIRARIADLDRKIRSTAPVNRAMRLGRVPWTVARLIRKLDRRGLLGNVLSVVGTHALFAYERMAGGHFHSSQIATADIDLLYDARDRVDLATSELREEGLRGLLREVDASFEPISPGSFRAVNKAGYLVDLVTPMPAQPSRPRPPKRIGVDAEDMHAAEIAGLGWLQSCPRVKQVVLDERGYPLRLDVPDPRAFALHKLWVSEQPDRDRAKARRDVAQAHAVAGLVHRFLPHLSFDGADLSSLPRALRVRSAELKAVEPLDEDEIGGW